MEPLLQLVDHQSTINYLLVQVKKYLILLDVNICKKCTTEVWHLNPPQHTHRAETLTPAGGKMPFSFL